MNLLLQALLLFRGKCAQLGDIRFTQLLQTGDARALLLDQLGRLEPLLLLELLRLHGSDLGGLCRRVPGFLGDHLQAIGRHCLGYFFLDQQTQLVALDTVAQQSEMVVSRGQLRVPEMHLLPGNRTLAAAGQAYRAAAQVRTASAPLGEAAQRNVPAAVRRAVLVEIQVEEHRRTNLQASVDQHINGAHLLVGVLRQVHHAVEYGFELRVQHLLADTAVIEEQYGLDRLRFDLHVRYPLWLTEPQLPETAEQRMKSTWQGRQTVSTAGAVTMSGQV